MRQCMRCGNACQATFCDNCRLFLQGQLPKGGITSIEVSAYDTAPLPVINNPVTPFPPINDLYTTQMERNIQGGGYDPVTPLPPLNAAYGTQAERALQNLQDAARRIAAVERNEHRILHASRLSPLRDISADIQRQSTPAPRTPGKSGEEEIEDLGDVPNLWAWFSSQQDEENEEEDERWEDVVDPLSSRHFPQKAEAARIELEDLKRAVSDGLATTSEVEIFKRWQAKQRLRWLIICMAIVAVAVLIIDSVLVAFFLRH